MTLDLQQTVVDDFKRCIFNIQTTKNQILITPKYGETFESYLDFYRSIVEYIDEDAILLTSSRC